MFFFLIMHMGIIKLLVTIKLIFEIPFWHANLISINNISSTVNEVFNVGIYLYMTHLFGIITVRGTFSKSGVTFTSC